MGRRGTHGIRNQLPPNRRDTPCRISVVDGEAIPRRGFFIPSFSVHRPLVVNDAALEFMGELTSFCRGRPYQPREIGKMGITLLEKQKFEGMFHRADVQPPAEEILDLVRNVRDALSNHVKRRPRALPVPLGNVAVFGSRDNQVAIVPEGWKGYTSAYATRDGEGRVGANRSLTREINAIVGEATQFVHGGADSTGEYAEVSARPLQRQAPHHTVATKTRGGSISNNERADPGGQIWSFMPPELKFYDPIIHLSLVTTRDSDRYLSNMGLVDESASGLFVRTPQRDDLSMIGYEKTGQGIYAPTPIG